MNNLMYDQKSRYNNVDDTNIVFMTPRQVEDLNIGFDTAPFKEEEYDDVFPFLVDTLKEMVKETTIGAVNGSEVELPVENAGNCGVFICVEINGKLCKLQSEEWDVYNNLHGLPANTQIKVFQRLLSDGQITLEDLEVADIDNSVYKKLLANDISGLQTCQRKLKEIDELVESQKKDKKLMKLKNRIIDSL